MKITTDELLTKKDWLHVELLNSLSSEIVDMGVKNGFYDVKLLVNGIELEPQLFTRIMDKLEEHIQHQAESLILEQYSEVVDKVRQLEGILLEAKEKLLNFV